MTDSNTNTKFDDKKQATKSDSSQQAEFLKKIEEMYRAGVHFGYSKSSRHPKMEPFFYNLGCDARTFNLEVVYSCLEKAMGFMEELGLKRSGLLLVSTKAEAKDVIEKMGRELGMPYVTERWLGGILTNFDAIKKRILHFEELVEKRKSSQPSSLSKKEASRTEKQFLKMERHFDGIKTLKELPVALVIVDPKREETTVKEARKKGIPIIAILNSDCDPTTVDYPIPGNDSSVSSLQYLLSKLTEAYKKGIKKSKTQTSKSETNSNDKNSKSET